MKKCVIPLALIYASCLMFQPVNSQLLFTVNSSAPYLEAMKLNKNHLETLPKSNIEIIPTKGSLQNWANELDSLGDIHNDAMAFSYEQLRSMNTADITSANVSEITARLTAEYFTNRYGATYYFTGDQLREEILKNGTTPPPIESLPVSDQLKNAFSDISKCLTNLKEAETSVDLKENVSQIVNNAYAALTEKEKMYLKAYEQAITKSFEYWEANAHSWARLAPQGISNIKIVMVSSKASASHINSSNPRQRHPCTNRIVEADVRGIIQGAIGGCITGSVLGVGVGCISAAIFGAGVNGASASLGAALACLITQN